MHYGYGCERVLHHRDTEKHGGPRRKETSWETASATQTFAWREVFTLGFVVLRGPPFFLRELRDEKGQRFAQRGQPATARDMSAARSR